MSFKEFQLDLVKLSRLPPGWGGPSSEKIDSLSISRGLRLTRRLVESGYFLPHRAEPRSDGIIILFWKKGNISLGYDIPKGDNSLWNEENSFNLLSKILDKLGFKE